MLNEYNKTSVSTIIQIKFKYDCLTFFKGQMAYSTYLMFKTLKPACKIPQNGYSSETTVQIENQIEPRDN